MSIRALMPTTALLIGAAILTAAAATTTTATPLGAQQVREAAPSRARISVQRSPGATAEMERLVRRMEVLTRQLEEHEYDTTERRRMLEELANVMFALAEVRSQATPRERTRLQPGEVVRVETMPSRHVELVQHSRQLMVAEGVPGMPRGWVGLNVSAPHTIRVSEGEQVVRFLRYPQVVSVDPSSPADRAGIRRGDTVVAYNGTDVREEIAMGRLLVPNARLAVRVRRDGQSRDVTLVVAPAPQNVVSRRFDLKFPEDHDVWVLAPSRAPRAPGVSRTVTGTAPTPAADPAAAIARGTSVRSRIAAAAPAVASAGATGAAGGSFSVHLAPNAFLGARVEAVSEELHDATGLPRGVLVMEVAQGSPAHAAGLRPGDVITGAAGRTLRNVPMLRASLQAARGQALALDVQRKKARRKVTLSW